jgi:hypothetical protein
LQHILGLAGAAEHPVRDPEQTRSHALENCRSLVEITCAPRLGRDTRIRHRFAPVW